MSRARLTLLLVNLALIAAWLGQFRGRQRPSPTATEARGGSRCGYVGRCETPGRRMPRRRRSGVAAARGGCGRRGDAVRATATTATDDDARDRRRSRRCGARPARTSPSCRARPTTRSASNRISFLVVDKQVAARRAADGARLGRPRPEAGAVRGDDRAPRADRRPGRRERGRRRHLRHDDHDADAGQVLVHRRARRWQEDPGARQRRRRARRARRPRSATARSRRRRRRSRDRRRPVRR